VFIAISYIGGVRGTDVWCTNNINVLSMRLHEWRSSWVVFCYY